jgi:uncharacterized protein YggU (UPF0235/DUF167 family)
MHALFDVHVVPSSSRTGPDGMYDGVPRLRVKAPPTESRANAEAEKTLGRLLGTRVTLVRGTRNRRKTFSADLPSSELGRRLRALFG